MSRAHVDEFRNHTGIYNRGTINGISEAVLEALGLPHQSIDMIDKIERHDDRYIIRISTICRLMRCCENTARKFLKPLLEIEIAHAVRRGDGVLEYFIRYPKWIMDRINARVAELKRRRDRRRSKNKQQTSSDEVAQDYKEGINNKQAAETESVDNLREESPKKQSAREVGGSGRQNEQITQKAESKPKEESPTANEETPPGGVAATVGSCRNASEGIRDGAMITEVDHPRQCNAKSHQLAINACNTGKSAACESNADQFLDNRERTESNVECLSSLKEAPAWIECSHPHCDVKVSFDPWNHLGHDAPLCERHAQRLRRDKTGRQSGAGSGLLTKGLRNIDAILQKLRGSPG